MEQDDKLKWTTKLIYGVGDVGNAVVNSAVQFFLMIFYTDGALIAPALVANALLVGKIWDAVNDPLFGWLSDRTTSRFGKRRVYMIFGALPLAVTIALLWFVPRGLSDTWVFLWIAFTFILFDTLWTLTNVPYYALTAELTDDYDERASLTAFRMVLGVPAYIVGAALTPALVGLFATKRVGYGAIGVFYGILAAVVLWVAAAGLKERKKISESKAKTPPLQTFLATLRNRPFVQLIVAYLVANMAFALIKTLMAYFLIYQLGMEEQVPVVMFLLLLFVALFLIPLEETLGPLEQGTGIRGGVGHRRVGPGSHFFPAARADGGGLRGRHRGGHQLLGPMGLPLGHGAGRGGLRPVGDGRVSRGHVLRRVGPGDEVLRSVGHRGLGLGAATLRLRAQCGAERANAPGHPVVLRAGAADLLRPGVAASDLVPHHPGEPCGDAEGTGG
ncbi:MAG: MFS transporter [Anaerolineae bacterium]|nr:MFS transporter [Anaerolineae bacterium]